MPTLQRNIVLIGMRGTGKSAIGRTLAEWLGWEFVDVDHLLEESEGQTIPSIVAAHGWDHFRDLESLYTAQAVDQSPRVVATGGGVILRQSNVDTLKQHGIVVWLRAPIEHLTRRVAASDRPSLTGQSPAAELATIYHARRELYAVAADVVVDVDFESANKKTDLLRKSKLVWQAVKKTHSNCKDESTTS